MSNPISFSVAYRGNPMSGVFAKLREKSIDLKKTVNIYTNDVHKYYNFCELNLESGDQYYIIDGNKSTAWANYEKKKTNVTIDFIFSNFFITGYSIIWACSPGSMTVEGSNDNETWFHVDTFNDIKTSNKEYKKCANPGVYRYIKFFNQEGRVHLSDIELFGVLNLNKLRKCTFSRSQRFIKNSLLLYLLVISG